jgi:hypothetical protein
MAESRHGYASARSVPPSRPPRRERLLFAALRHVMTVLAGAAVAFVASYLLRKIGL